VPLTARNICSDALIEIGALAAGETAAPEDADLALGKLNRLLDNWNADRGAIYAEQSVSYVLTPSLNPHTIGPTGTFVVTQRPEAIDGATLIIDDDVRIPVRLRNADWYRALSIQTIESLIPTDLYFEATWPNGSIYLWPIPSSAYHLELMTRRVLASLALSDTFTLPPGYQDAITLTLAESLVSPFGAASKVSPTLVNDAAKARARVWAANDRPRPLRTRDAGIPGDRRGTFNYLTGMGS
jgi:hypothetical protein